MSNIAACYLVFHNFINYLFTKPNLQDSSSKLTEDSHSLEKLSDDLMKVEKTLTVLLNSRKDEGKPGYWTRVAKRINKVFIIVYVTVVGLFLSCISLTWYHAADE